MIKRYEFTERIIYIIRKELEENLPNEDTLEAMIDKAKELIKKIL